MRVPAFFRASLTDDPAALAARAPYPCVLKPLGLSASRGVIRANDRAEFVAAFRRIAKIGERELQVESYIPGREFAVEGLVTAGKLQPLAIFDKPDPMEGPFFEETIYVTPSREPARGAGGVDRDHRAGGSGARPVARAGARGAALQRRGRLDPGGTRAAHRRTVRARAAYGGRDSAGRGDSAARAWRQCVDGAVGRAGFRRDDDSDSTRAGSITAWKASSARWRCRTSRM